MNEMRILERLKENLPARLLEAVDTLDTELLLYFERCIQDIKGLNDADSLTSLQFAILTGYVVGVTVQKQRSPNPLVNHIKENDLIGVEFELDSKLGGMYVPGDMPNTKIKKLIQEAAKEQNARWNGKFRKLSEIENRKKLKEVSEIFGGI